MRGRAGTAARWLAVALLLVLIAAAFGHFSLPTPYLFAALLAGILYALLARPALFVPRSSSVAAQAVIGVAAGSFLERSTLREVGAHAAPILGTCVATVVLSIVAGLLLTRIAPVDPATAAFGMIAGGAAGIISISRSLGADERLVAVMQYMRVLIIVAATPAVAIGIFGAAQRAPTAAVADAGNIHRLAFVLLVGAGGLALARAARLPAGGILGPMIVAGAVSLIDRPLVAPAPTAVADLAFAIIGLDVGLRFTPHALREAGAILVPAVAMIVAMTLVSAGFGILLTVSTGVSMLDGYLATTPGGLSAVLALAVGSKTNTTFVVAVQVIRTFLMLAAAPPLARWLSSRRVPEGATVETYVVP